MTQASRRFITLATLSVVLGVLIAATEFHRLALAWAWPFWIAFWNTYIAF
jgi:hypothetical protein